MITTDRGGSRRRVLVNNAGAEGRSPYRSFPAEVFEDAVFAYLKEIDPHEILNGDQGPDETQALGQRQAAVEAELAEATAFMEVNGFSKTIGKRVATLEAEHAELTKKLTAAREKAAHPLSETWGETKTLLVALRTAKDKEEARLRLRSALRRIISEIRILVVPVGRDRLCAVQVWFARGEHAGRQRSYLIVNRPPKANARARTEGGWWCRSLAGMHRCGDLDLRRREDAAALEAELLALDLDRLTAELPGGRAGG
jgi:hypothetical protein